MYCPKCTLEIKGEDQVTCPICSEPLIDSPVEKIEEPTPEDLKLQELIADIDSSVSGATEDSSSKEIPDLESEEPGEIEPDFKLEMDDKLSESEPEPDGSGEDFSIDLEKEFSLDDEMIDGELTADQLEEGVYDLEKELGLVDEKIKSIDEEPPSIDFDKLALTEEEKSFALNDAVEADDSAESDAKEDFNKTLEELDPIKDMVQSQKKSSSFGLIALIIIVIVVFGVAYTKFKPEIDALIKPDAEKIAKDEQLKEKFGPKADKVDEKAVVEEKEFVVKKVPEQPVESAVDKPVEKPATEKVEEIIEVKEVESLLKPSDEKSEKVAEENKVVAPPKPVKKEVVEPAKPSVTYSIHAGSFRKSIFAQKDVTRFNKLGFNAYIQRVNLGDKGIWYRVKVGLYDTKAEAVAAEKELQNKAKVQTRIVRNK